MTIKDLLSISKYGEQPIEFVVFHNDTDKSKNVWIKKMKTEEVSEYLNKLNKIQIEDYYKERVKYKYLDVHSILADEDLCNLEVLNFGIEDETSIYVNV